MKSVLLLAALALCACGSNSETTDDDSARPSPPDRCPSSWTSGTEIATGKFSLAAAEVPIKGDWKVGVEALPQEVTVHACIIEMYDSKMQAPGKERWVPWERVSFAATWRAPGPISERTKVAGGTLTGTPGMSGLFARLELDEDACRKNQGCKPEPDETFYFMRDGASELFVDRLDPFARAFSSNGWVLTDVVARDEKGNPVPPPVQIDLDIDVAW